MFNSKCEFQLRCRSSLPSAQFAQNSFNLFKSLGRSKFQALRIILDPFRDDFRKFEQNFDRNGKNGFSYDFSPITRDDTGRLISPKKRARPHLEPIITRFFDYLDENTTFSNFFQCFAPCELYLSGTIYTKHHSEFALRQYKSLLWV